MAQIYADRVLPKDAVVLISGANGYIGSHIAEEALEAGLRVRGTVRSLKKSAWATKFFETKYGSDRFELIEIPDMGAPGAFDNVVKGVSGFIHTASDMSFDSNPNNVIPNVIAGIRNAMSSAAKEPSIKRFVYTSSSSSVTLPKINEDYSVDVNSWNDEAVRLAWKEPYDDPLHGLYTYAASKTEAEKAAWQFMEENKPGFVLNCVLPNMNWGSILDDSQFSASTPNFITILFEGNVDAVKGFPPQHFVDVTDTARLHIVALLNPEVHEERVFAFTAPFNWSEVLQVFRKLYPTRSFPADIPDEGHDLLKVVPKQRAVELLQPFGQSDWVSLEESIKKHTDRLVAAGR